ncbi:MAG: hypothetical protein QW215_08315 [Ignisphaera sp.]
MSQIEELKKLKKKLDELEGIDVSKLREDFDNVINLTKNNVDFSVYMLRKENIIVFYCTDRSYCRNYALVFKNKEKAKMLVEIAENVCPKHR